MANPVGSPPSTDGFARLVTVMRLLRAEAGCPWDRAQSLRTLQPYLVEETHELLDAIDDLGRAADAVIGAAATDTAVASAPAASVAALREELGDVLLQVVFQAQIAADYGWFNVDDVATTIADKMQRRHPHVFGDEDAADAAAVVRRWAEIKRDEGKGLLDGIPRALPALLRGQKTGAKAAQVGFDWPDVDGALAKVDEELLELRQALKGGEAAAIEHELGDTLFALTSVARHAGVDAEGALRRTLDRFGRRFAVVEAAIAGSTTEGPASAEQLDAFWDEAKAQELAATAAAAGSSTVSSLALPGPGPGGTK